MLYIKLMFVNLETGKKTLIFVEHVDYSDRVRVSDRRAPYMFQKLNSALLS